MTYKQEREITKTFLKRYGNSIREARKLRNLTQLQLAKKLGTSDCIISFIECGYMLPPSSIEEPLLEILLQST